MTHASVLPIEHAIWCDRNHPETCGGMSYLVSERHWVTPATPYTDAPLNAALLHSFRQAAEQEGTPLLREMGTDGTPLMRLCAAFRLRELERQVSELIAAAGRLTRVN